MCQTVIFKKTKLECFTVAELKKALPNLELIKKQYYGVIREEVCLCQIDLDKTFDNAGLKWKSESMEFTLLEL